MSKIKNGRLDQYGPEPFGRLILLQWEKCETERVNATNLSIVCARPYQPRYRYQTRSVVFAGELKRRQEFYSSGFDYESGQYDMHPLEDIGARARLSYVPSYRGRICHKNCLLYPLIIWALLSDVVTSNPLYPPLFDVVKFMLAVLHVSLNHGPNNVWQFFYTFIIII